LPTTRERLLKNTMARLLNQGILVISSFAIAVPLARWWGAESFGRYSFAIAFAALFGFSFDWGLHWLLTREVARDKGNVARYLNNALGLTLVLSLFTMAVLILLINVFDYPAETILAVYLAGTWTWLEVLASLFIRGAFYAFERMDYETPPLLAERLIAVVCGLAVLRAHSGLIALLCVLVASRLLKLLLCLVIYARRIGHLGVEFDWRFWRFLARSTFPFGLNLALGLIYTKVDITMLSLLRRNEAEIGFYRAALALVMYWPALGTSLTSSLFPMMSELYLSRRDSFIRNYRRSVQWLFALGLPMTVGLCLLGDRFITSIYGQSFVPAVVSLRILSGSVLLKFIHGTLAMVLTSSNRQALRTGIVASAALGNTLLNLLLIPWAGHVGASVAAVLTDSWILVTCYLVVSRQLGRLRFSAALGPSTLSAIVMGLGVLLLRRTSLLLLIPAAVVTYAVALCALGGVPREQLAKWKELLPLRWWRRV